MILILCILGIVVIIFSLIVGIGERSFGWFVFGIFGSVIYFSLAYLINRTHDLEQLIIEMKNTKKRHAENVMCEKCNEEHEKGIKSCPHCGYRN